MPSRDETGTVTGVAVRRNTAWTGTRGIAGGCVHEQRKLSTRSRANITDAANSDFDDSFSRADGGAGNYAFFLVNGDGFTLTAASGRPGSEGSAPINGIQIVHGDRIFGNGFD